MTQRISPERLILDLDPVRDTDIVCASKAYGRLLIKSHELLRSEKMGVLFQFHLFHSRLNHHIYLRDRVVLMTPLGDEIGAIRHFLGEGANLVGRFAP